MKIAKYKLLIQNLPVREQSFHTKQSTWKKYEVNKYLLKFNNQLFGKNKSITISRNDIFTTESTQNLIIKTIYWGYPRGMRGKNFSKVLRNLEAISKLLYFNKMSINNQPCLILDQRIIDLFKSKTFDELNELEINNSLNAIKLYPDYLELIHRIASDLSTSGENIEQFLFLFGNNLKS